MTIIFILLILILSMLFVYSMFSISGRHDDETEEEFMKRMKEYEDNKKSQE